MSYFCFAIYRLKGLQLKVSIPHRFWNSIKGGKDKLQLITSVHKKIFTFKSNCNVCPGWPGGEAGVWQDGEAAVHRPGGRHPPQEGGGAGQDQSAPQGFLSWARGDWAFNHNHHRLYYNLVV